MGLYCIYIRDLLEVFPRDQVMVLRLEHYSQNKQQKLQQMFEFLGLSKNVISVSRADYSVHGNATTRVFYSSVLAHCYKTTASAYSFAFSPSASANTE